MYVFKHAGTEVDITELTYVHVNYQADGSLQVVVEQESSSHTIENVKRLRLVVEENR